MSAERASHPRPDSFVHRRSRDCRTVRASLSRGRRRPRQGRADRGGRRSARRSCRRSRRRGGRRSFGLPHHAGIHRRPYPLSADPGDRLLRRAAARLAAQLHLRRGAEIRRSRSLRADRRILSRRTDPLRHDDGDGLLHGPSAVGRRVFRRGRAARRAHDRRQDDDGPRRARGAERYGSARLRRKQGADRALARTRAARLCDHAALRGDLEPGATGGGGRAGARIPGRLRPDPSRRERRPRSSSWPSSFPARATISTSTTAQGCSDRARSSATASISRTPKSSRSRRPGRSRPSVRRRICFSDRACSIRLVLFGRACRVALATDVGGGTSYSMLRTAAEGYKVLQLNRQSWPAAQAFYRMTLGNARALEPRRPDRLDRGRQGSRSRRARFAGDAGDGASHGDRERRPRRRTLRADHDGRRPRGAPDLCRGRAGEVMSRPEHERGPRPAHGSKLPAATFSSCITGRKIGP